MQTRRMTNYSRVRQSRLLPADLRALGGELARLCRLAGDTDRHCLYSCGYTRDVLAALGYEAQVLPVTVSVTTPGGRCYEYPNPRLRPAPLDWAGHAVLLADTSIGGVMLDWAAAQLGPGLPQVLSARVECPWVFQPTTVRNSRATPCGTKTAAGTESWTCPRLSTWTGRRAAASSPRYSTGRENHLRTCALMAVAGRCIALCGTCSAGEGDGTSHAVSGHSARMTSVAERSAPSRSRMRRSASRLSTGGCGCSSSTTPGLR